jgi:uncharacterized phage protein gp47/JayE
MPGPVQSVYLPVPTIMAQMIAQMQSENSPLTDFSEGSTTRSIQEAVAIVVSGQSQVADQLQLDSFLETATGEALDAQGGNWRVERLPAVQATGTVKIIRESSAGALVIPAAWAQLTLPPAAPGGEGVAVLTTANAEFAEGVTEVTVAAQAVIGGTAGNISNGSFLTPLSPVSGISSSTGFVVATTFTGGVNEETDEAYRKRIPLVVQGRVKGTNAAFEGGVLSVPGVESVGVLKAGTERSNSTAVEGGYVEVVYRGSAGLLGAVESAVESAASVNQKLITAAAISLSTPRGYQRVLFSATIYFAAGVNPVTLEATVKKLAVEYVNKAGMGSTLFMSGLIEAIHGIPEVVSIGLPLAKLAVSPGSGATDIACYPDQCVNLAEGDINLTMVEL